jgi:hypothetical protein
MPCLSVGGRVDAKGAKEIAGISHICIAARTRKSRTYTVSGVRRCPHLQYMRQTDSSGHLRLNPMYSVTVFFVCVCTVTESSKRAQSSDFFLDKHSLMTNIEF